MAEAITVGERELDEAGLLLCNALGLDPDEVTRIRLELVAGRGMVVSWQSIRRVDVQRIVDALNPDDARPGPHTWDEEHPDDAGPAGGGPDF